MGMFDTMFDENAEIVCPHCNKKHNVDDGIQTKALDKVLYNYGVGDVVELSNKDINFIEDWDWCKHCKERIPVFFGITHCIFVGIFQTKELAINGSNNFDVFSNYKIQYTDRVKHQERCHTLENRIQSTIEIHGNKPAQSSFGIMYNLHHNFIDYDIIKTLKNILSYN